MEILQLHVQMDITKLLKEIFKFVMLVHQMLLLVQVIHLSPLVIQDILKLNQHV